MQRLSLRMQSQVLPAVTAELALKNVFAAPRFKCIKINVGIGSLSKKTKDFSDVISNLTHITGQKPVITKAKKAISNFKLRQGVPAGLLVTLRGPRMYDFLDRLVNIVLPRVRDFRGLSRKAFDGHGNYSIGLREALVFPEVKPEEALNVQGLQITIVTTAKNDAEGFALLKAIGFPFKKES